MTRSPYILDRFWDILSNIPFVHAKRANPANAKMGRVRDKRLDKLVAAVVAARSEYNRRYAAMQAIKPCLTEAIRASDEADKALQDYLSELAKARGPSWSPCHECAGTAITEDGKPCPGCVRRRDQ